MTNYYYKGDLPPDFQWKDTLAIDTETLGLSLHRDRLCVVQIALNDGHAHIVHLQENFHCPILKSGLLDPKILKIFHFGRFDIAAIYKYLGILCQPVYCTKIASKLTRTYTDYHGLKNLCNDLLSVELSKQAQCSDWGSPTLSKNQINYAASDVLHLHALKTKLDEMLQRENRFHLAHECFQFLPTRALLDLAGWQDDIFSHLSPKANF